MKTKTENKKKRFFGRLTAIMLALVAIGSCALTASAATISAWPRGDASDRVHTHYENIPVMVSASEKEVSDCYLIDETTYAPLRSLCEAVCGWTSISFDAKTRTAYVKANGLALSAQDGSYYIVANGRYLYADTPVRILDDGRTYLPIRLLSRALGVDVKWDAATRSVRIDGGFSPILSGDQFYDADAVYWLSRIISAESRGEPLLGQIAVGNVVLNRVKSPEFPNTIWGVIFDRKHGVQFTPVANGTVYHAPAASSVIAAKLCLEGVTVSERALYFLNPSKASSFWIVQTRPFAFRIGTHHFYY
ncbi:MAG: cell wall hydrolase [Clostridia bacterium]|nr:cell wall hydrolase [Clostridia bacterium]